MTLLASDRSKQWPKRLVAGFLIACAACSHSRRNPDLGQIYDELAQVPDYLRNPVIVIPGILGSRLIESETGQVVWGNFDRNSANPNKNDGIRLVSLPMREGVPLHMLRDSVRSDGPLDRLGVNVVGIPINVNAYAQILSSLGVGGYRDSHGATKKDDVSYSDEHFTCFQFDYDWRRDISETAQEFHQFVLAQRQYVIKEMHRRYGVDATNVKFDIVAHSMGGLLARYYLRYGDQILPQDGSPPELTWAGSNYVQRVILVGTPNAGSVSALHELIDGSRVSVLLPKYQPAILGTFPSVYQLLPRPHNGSVVDAGDTSRKLDLYNPALWRQLQWGLSAPDQDEVVQAILPDVAKLSDRRRIAADHQQKCLARALQFHRALDLPAIPPPGLSMHLFAGDAIETDSIIAVDLTNGKTKVLAKNAGDSTVTRNSAMGKMLSPMPNSTVRYSPIRWTSKMFLPTDHLGLTRDPVFVDNVLSLLLDSPSLDSPSLGYPVRSAYMRNDRNSLNIGRIAR